MGRYSILRKLPSIFLSIVPNFRQNTFKLDLIEERMDDQQESRMSIRTSDDSNNDEGVEVCLAYVDQHELAPSLVPTWSSLPRGQV